MALEIGDNADFAQLKEIAGNSVFRIKDFEHMYEVVQEVAKKACT